MGAGGRNFVVLVAAIIHLWAVAFYIASIATPHYSQVDDYRSAQQVAIGDLAGTNIDIFLFSAGLRQSTLSYNMFTMCLTQAGEDTVNCKSLLVERGNKHGSKIPEWLRASQAFSIMGACFAIVSLLLAWLTVVRLLCPCAPNSQYRLALLAVLTLVAGVFILIAVIIFAAKYQAVGFIFYKPDYITQNYEDLSPVAQQEYDGYFSLDWGFDLGVTAGCLLCIMSAANFFAAWLDRSVVKDIGPADFRANGIVA